MAYGYPKKLATRNAKLNLEQARLVSGLRPGYVMYGKNPEIKAIGIFRTGKKAFKLWGVRGYGGLRNPLASILFVVNAQVHADKIVAPNGEIQVIDGTHNGWYALGKNPCPAPK